MNRYGLVTNIACSEHTMVLEQIENLLGEAAAQELTGFYAAQKAQTYLDRFTGVSYQHPVLPSTCAKEVATAKSHYNALATMIQNSGGGLGGGGDVPLYTPDQLMKPPEDITGTIKTVAVAAAVIAGAVVVLPIVLDVVGVRAAHRRVSGYRRNRRNRR